MNNIINKWAFSLCLVAHHEFINRCRFSVVRVEVHMRLVGRCAPIRPNEEWTLWIWSIEIEMDACGRWFSKNGVRVPVPHFPFAATRWTWVHFTSSCRFDFIRSEYRILLIGVFVWIRVFSIRTIQLFAVICFSIFRSSFWHNKFSGYICICNLLVSRRAATCWWKWYIWHRADLIEYRIRRQFPGECNGNHRRMRYFFLLLLFVVHFSCGVRPL